MLRRSSEVWKSLYIKSFQCTLNKRHICASTGAISGDIRQSPTWNTMPISCHHHFNCLLIELIELINICVHPHEGGKGLIRTQKEGDAIRRVFNILVHQLPRRSSCLLTMQVVEPAPDKQEYVC